MFRCWLLLLADWAASPRSSARMQCFLYIYLYLYISVYIYMLFLSQSLISDSTSRLGRRC